MVSTSGQLRQWVSLAGRGHSAGRSPVTRLASQVLDWVRLWVVSNSAFAFVTRASCLTRVGSLIASPVAFLTCVGAGFGRPLHERYSGISGALVLQRRHRDCE